MVDKSPCSVVVPMNSMGEQKPAWSWEDASPAGDYWGSGPSILGKMQEAPEFVLLHSVNRLVWYIYIYIPGKPYGHFFLSIMGFTRNGRFFCSIAYFGFWLWRVVQILWQHRVRTSSDSFQKRNFSPKWSKLGVVIGHPNLATNTAIFPTKFGCTHKIPVFFQHHVEKNSKQMSTYCPKYCL